jgi:hypothetical protein
MTRPKQQPPWAMFSFIVNVARLIYTVVITWIDPWNWR